MNRRFVSLAITFVAAIALIAIVWFGGGALWHLLLKMHGRG